MSSDKLKSDSKSLAYQVQWIDQAKRQQDFSKGWRFLLANLGLAQKPSFDDSDWEQISLPHDFSITQPYTVNGEAESAYKLGGVAWYRKYFALDPSLLGHRIWIHFDGAYMEAEVYINGQLLGRHCNGYQSFTYDLSHMINFGQENLLAVRLENKVPSSRWYSGSGLYRDVSISVLPEIHVERDQVRLNLSQINHRLDIDFGLSQIVEASEYQVGISLLELAPDFQPAACIYQMAPKDLPSLQESEAYKVRVDAGTFKLWSPDSPHLYQLEIDLYHKGKLSDKLSLETGFRYYHFDHQHGLSLNGLPFKLQGVCLHHDQGSLGASAFEDAIIRQLSLLKDMGANTIRVAHNPSARKLKKWANRLGLFLIEEAFDTWTYPKNGNQHDFSSFFHQPLGGQNARFLKRALSAKISWAQYSIESMILSGIHDPSVLMWSIGNELMEGFSADVSHYPMLGRQICDWILALDRTRPITFGDNKLKDSSFLWFKEIAEIAEYVTCLSEVEGLVGLNYAKGSDYDQLHQDYPEWILYGSETSSAINSRGCYQTSNQNCELTSYDQSTVDWGSLSSESWYDAITRDFVAGECVWTGFDYLGEPTPWNKIDSGSATKWPSPKHSYFGIMDTAGFAKDRYYFYQSQWSKKKNTLHLLPTWQKGDIQLDEDGLVEVVVYSNAASVALVFESPEGQKVNHGLKSFTQYRTPTGHSYQLYEGEDASEIPHENLYLKWRIPYRKGTLRALAYDETGKVISQTSGRKQVQNYGKVASLHWKLFESPLGSPRNLLFVELSLVDAKGELVANSHSLVHIQVKGQGKLLTLDNGNPFDHRSYDQASRKAYRGKLLLIIASAGQAGSLEITAKVLGLATATYKLELSERAENVRLLTYKMRKYQFSIAEKNQSSSQLLQIPGLPMAVFCYKTSLSIPLLMDSPTQNLMEGQDVFLPGWIQARTADGSLISKALPVSWNVANPIFSKAEIIKGETTFLDKVLECQAFLQPIKKSLRIHQDISLVAQKHVLAPSDDKVVFTFKYDTIQAIGAISIEYLNLPLKEVTISLSYRSHLVGPAKNRTVFLNQVNSKEQVHFFDETLDVLQLEVKLEAKTKQKILPKNFKIGLWNLIEEG